MGVHRCCGRVERITPSTIHIETEYLPKSASLPAPTPVSSSTLPPNPIAHCASFLQIPGYFRHSFSGRFLHNAESIEPAVNRIPCRELNTRKWEQSAFRRLLARVLRRVGECAFRDSADAYWRSFRNISEVKLVGAGFDASNCRTDLSTTSTFRRSLRITTPFRRERSGCEAFV